MWVHDTDMVNDPYGYVQYTPPGSPPPSGASYLNDTLNSFLAGKISPGQVDEVLNGLDVGNNQSQIANQNAQTMAQIANQKQQIANQSQLYSGLSSLFNGLGSGSMFSGLFGGSGKGSGAGIGGLLNGLFGGSGGSLGSLANTGSMLGAQTALQGFGAPLMTGFQATNGPQGASMNVPGQTAGGAPSGAHSGPNPFSFTNAPGAVKAGASPFTGGAGGAGGQAMHAFNRQFVPPSQLPMFDLASQAS